MRSYAFRLLNVFAESTFGGNPLCVFEDARGMDDNVMLQLARQFNLSETTFILPSDRADANVRIFTPGYEMRFAGHPTLGTAHVVRDLYAKGDEVSLEFKAGVVSVRARDDVWTFTAPCPGGVKTAPSALSIAQAASFLGLRAEDILEAPLWVDTGADQLLISLKSRDALDRVAPDMNQLHDWPDSSLDRKTAYVFVLDQAGQASGRQRVHARYFFAKGACGIDEDPGTGSACANLGGWLLARQHALPARIVVSQGEQMERPCQLYLDLSADGVIEVGGRVIEIGRGVVTI